MDSHKASGIASSAKTHVKLQRWIVFEFAGSENPERVKMTDYADGIRKNKTPETADAISRKGSGFGESVQLVDNRPEAIAQRKLQEAAASSPRVKQAVQFQSLGIDRPASRNPVQKAENNTGIPDNLKTGIESLSGYSMDHVKVHYNSDKPAQLNAHAYAQGSDIHIAPHQEKHLPHEAWHVVQQMQGRVRPTMQMKENVNVNDDAGLESEADAMGEKAMQGGNKPYHDLLSKYASSPVAQRTTRPSRRNRSKKKKNQGAAEQNSSGGFSYLDHYGHKLPHLFDLLTSFRRQRMLITSTLTREYLHRFSTGSFSSVPANEIILLHPNSLEDTKTKKRYDIILKFLEKNKSKTSISKDEISDMIPSDEGIQVAKVADNRYVSMQGVGRIVAMKEAAKAAKRNVSIEITMYDLSDMPVIPGQLEAIAASYHSEEGWVSKTFGAVLGVGLTSYLLNYASGGRLLQLASSLATFVVNKMELDLAQAPPESSDAFAFQYPSGTRTDEY